jgi:hypothetical protein
MFQIISPEEFIIIFGDERAQTKAFILSFSPRKNYVQKVLHLLDVQESDEKDLMNRSSFIIRDYLNRCQEDNINMDFVQTVEKEVESMIKGYENSHNLHILRKRLLFKHPEEVLTILKIEKEAEENDDREKSNSLFKRFYHS